MLEKKQLSCCLFLFLSCFGYANERPSEYIERFREIAIAEMQRSGIPASITLAQAIHESFWGRGELAVHSNNYFGIKCKTGWQGKKYYKTDDDYDENNKLVESCFRVYATIEASFEDHSDFLQSGKRYERLFQLDIRDYRNWANGLQECGYATDRQYGKKLIGTIEKYGLHQYDTISVPVETQPIAEQPTYQVDHRLLEEPESIPVKQEIRKWENRRKANPQSSPATAPAEYPVNTGKKQENTIRLNGNSRQVQLMRIPRRSREIRR